MIRKDNITLVEYKTLRSSPAVRLLLDLGEVDSEIIKQIHELRALGEQKLSLILCRTEDLKTITKEEE